MNTFFKLQNIETKKVSTERRAQYETCKLSFILKKMRTIIQVTASHSSQELFQRGKGTLISEGGMSSHAHTLAETCC